MSQNEGLWNVDIECGLRMQDGGKIQSFASLGLANRRAQQPAKKHKNTKKTNTEKTNTQKTNTKKTNTKRQTHKRQIQKKNTRKTRAKKTCKTYLGLIRLRVPGGEGRGSGKRKKIRIFQLKEQESTTYRACF